MKHERTALIVVDMQRGMAARTAGNLGFTATVVSDATFTFARKDYAGVPRSAEEVHAMSLANLDGEFATIATAKDVNERIQRELVGIRGCGQ